MTRDWDIAKAVHALLLSGETVPPSLMVLIRHAKQEADRAWDACSEARVRLDDLNAEYERGKAHALCDLLGDQDALDRLLAMFPEMFPELVTKSGKVLTESDIYDLAQEAEAGYDVTELAGRPSRRMGTWGTCDRCGNEIIRIFDVSGQRGGLAWRQTSWPDDRGFQCGLSADGLHHPAP